jgi:NTE family protein
VADGEGNLHVDGAVLDNLPVAAMRGLGTDRVIAIDVSAPDEFRVSADSPEIASALTPFRQADKNSPRYPNLVKVLNRTAQVTSLGAREIARDSADVVIAPPLEGVGLTEYSAASRTIETGYRSACEALDRAAGDIAGWT